MTRKGTYLDAMLRHFGVAYYESLDGSATRADGARALDTVEERLGEAAREPEPGAAKQDAGRPLHRWARRVGDVMTTSVVTVHLATPYKEIARLLAEHRAPISGLPVLMMGGQVVGVVTEADRQPTAVCRSEVEGGCDDQLRGCGQTTRHACAGADRIVVVPCGAA